MLLDRSSSEGVTRRWFLRIGGALGALWSLGAYAQGSRLKVGRSGIADTPIVRQVDHILIRTDFLEPLFSFFSDTVQLPIVMPFASNGMVGKGAVSTGNVCLEIAGRVSPPSQPRQASVSGFAFEPLPLVESLAELDRREIAHGEPETQQRDGERLWTNVMITELTEGWDSMGDFIQNWDRSQTGLIVFLCEYHALDHDWVRTWAPSHRRALRDQLRTRQGGPLGIVGLSQITIGIADYPDAVARWQRLFAPAPSLGRGRTPWEQAPRSSLFPPQRPLSAPSRSPSSRWIARATSSPAMTCWESQPNNS